MEIARNQNLEHDVHYRRALFSVCDDSSIEPWDLVLGDMDGIDNNTNKYYDPIHLSLGPLNNTSNNCSLCNVDWGLDHVSLDCHECGGYSMSRPCVTCDGKCGSVWKRDLIASHVKNEAVWTGECKRSSNNINNHNNRCKNENANETSCSSSKNKAIKIPARLQLYV